MGNRIGSPDVPILTCTLLVISGIATLAGAEDPGAVTPGAQAVDTSSSHVDTSHIIADLASASYDNALGGVIDSSANHDDALGGGGGADSQPTTLVPVDPGNEPVWVGGSQSGAIAPDNGHGTATTGFGTTPQGFGTTSRGFGSTQAGFGSNDHGFGGTPSQPGSGRFTDPSVDYGHQLPPIRDDNAPAGSAPHP